MLFNSFVFLFAFLPLTLIAYFALNRLRLFLWAKLVLVVASLLFYAYFNLSYLPIILSSIAVNYALARGISKSRGNSSQNHRHFTPKALLIIGLIFNIGLLGYFKYTDFFISNVNSLFSTNFTLQHILLPLGISFFTFQQIAFLIDSYKVQGTIPLDLLDYCNFVTFFPQLIAGPIVLSDEMLPQFEDKHNKRPIAKNIIDGLFMLAMGLVKKVFVADSIAVFANCGFQLAEKGGLTMAEAWLTSLSYTFQLYFDFSGYCDMAIGIGLLFNIRLPLNFNIPYRAVNFQDFWHRWHITLNRFLTQYIYIPLGGSRQGTHRTYLNIFIVFLVSGFWHGAGWTFIIWGVLHGLFVMTCRAWHKAGCHLPDWLGAFITFMLVNILWVIFRADNMEMAWNVIRSMFDNFQLTLTPAFTSNLPSILPNRVNMLILAVAVLTALFGPSAYQLMTGDRSGHLLTPSRHLLLKETLTVIAIAVGILFVSRVETFLYFNF